MPGVDARIGLIVGEKVTVRIVRPIGEGGMGTVYAAQSTTTELPYAVKVLQPRLCHQESALRRFFREAMTASNIRHPGVISVVDVGRLDDGSGYYVMEFLEGEDLARTLRREGRLAWRRVRHLILQICDAMAVVHAHGIVHRDLKPANCFRTARGPDHDALKILDFGVAKIAYHDASTLTGDGAFLGTLPYMAPELLQPRGAHESDHRGDLWATAVMLHELLTGDRPFRADNVFQLFAMISTHAASPLSAADVEQDWPDGLEAILARALQKDPEHRFQDMGAFALALRELDDPPGVRRVRAPTATGVDPLGSTAERSASPTGGATATATSTGMGDPADTETARLLGRLRARADFLLDPASRWHDGEELMSLPHGASMQVVRHDLCMISADAVVCGITHAGPAPGSLARQLCEFGGPEVAGIVSALGALVEGSIHFVRGGRLAASYVLFAVLPSRRPSPARVRSLLDQIAGACLERSGRPPIQSIAVPLRLLEALGVPPKECLEGIVRAFSRRLESSPPFTLSMLRIIIDDGGERLARSGGELVVQLPPELTADHEQRQRFVVDRYPSAYTLGVDIAESLPSRIRPPTGTFGTAWSLSRRRGGERLSATIFDGVPEGSRSPRDVGLEGGEIFDLALHDFGLPNVQGFDERESLDDPEAPGARLAFVDWSAVSGGTLGKVGFHCAAYDSVIPLLHHLWSTFPNALRPPPATYGLRWALRERGRDAIIAIDRAAPLNLEAIGFVPGSEFEIVLLEPPLPLVVSE